MTVNELLQRLVEICQKGGADFDVRVLSGGYDPTREALTEIWVHEKDKEVDLDS